MSNKGFYDEAGVEVEVSEILAEARTVQADVQRMLNEVNSANTLASSHSQSVSDTKALVDQTYASTLQVKSDTDDIYNSVVALRQQYPDPFVEVVYSTATTSSSRDISDSESNKFFVTSAANGNTATYNLLSGCTRGCAIMVCNNGDGTVVLSPEAGTIVGASGIPSGGMASVTKISSSPIVWACTER